ncbi:TrmH family RNA methyltransferase [Jejudonia soesokkakensis]|uniref:tRNA (guanosine(18)-2'-O)-methyltransferase n=1 Tax=Jejudonia soesokkakensis TaxID=1323432 RepID=A0ABW2MS98_9FLAO
MQQELLAYLRGYLTERRAHLFQEILAKRTRHFTVVTEDVYQLHNTSAVMRSCEVFGVQDLHIIEELNQKSIDKEIAMGAQKWVSLQRHDSTKACIHTLKKEGYQIVATSPHEHSHLLHDFDVTKKSAFFFGKESYGLSDAVLREADTYLKIPMYGFTESLNISVSAAIILQYVVTKLKQSTIDWRLSEAEKLELEIEWSKNTIKASDEIVARFLND